MSSHYPKLAWLTAYTERREGGIPGTYTASYRLSVLIAQGLIDVATANQFLESADLHDFFWEITWAESFETPDDMLIDRIADVEGYAIFVHGWTGNHRIFEDLPAMTVLTNRRIVAITVDHNGFGESRFRNDSPSEDLCNPPAAAHTLQNWIDLMGIRRQAGQTGVKVVNLIGHSMGGAMLFYFNPMQWKYGELTRCAIAPALLLEDELHRVFYTALGLGIGMLQKLPMLEIVERFIKPGVMKTLLTGASEYVHQTHELEYVQTPKGVTGATFMAMGRLRNEEIARDWDLFRVMLGHRDPLVGLVDMMDLLGKLEIPASNIRVVPGTHYMFSIGHSNPLNAFQHAQNRELIISDILDLHARALKMQAQGRLMG
ncbi:hypothetical protein MASR2M15_11370 [Anaerolineales bacterium]